MKTMYYRVPQTKVDYFDYSMKLDKDALTAEAQEWSPAWFGGMYGPVTVGETEDETQVFAYCLPTWGLHYVLKTAVPEGAEGGKPNGW